MSFHAGEAISWLWEIAKQSKSVAVYFTGLAEDLKTVPRIRVGKESGRLMEEIQWKNHAPAQAMFRTDAIGVKLPFPKCWIEFELDDGSVLAMLLRHPASGMIVGVAFEKDPPPRESWMIHRCEFLVIIESIVDRKREEIRSLFRSMAEEMMDSYGNQAVLPLPIEKGLSDDAVQETCSSMELHLWALYLFLAAVRLPEFSLVRTGGNGGPPSFEFVQTKPMMIPSKQKD